MDKFVTCKGCESLLFPHVGTASCTTLGALNALQLGHHEIQQQIALMPDLSKNVDYDLNACSLLETIKRVEI